MPAFVRAHFFIAECDAERYCWGMNALSAFLSSMADGPRDGVVRAAPVLLGMPEAEIIGRLRLDDERIYERVYRVFRPRLAAIAREYVPSGIADDIAHDTLTLVWERRSTWPVERGLATYLYAVARNRARDHLRHEGVVGRVVAHGLDVVETPGAGAPPLGPDVLVERHELGQAFIKALRTLPEGARVAFTLRWVHQLSYPEIAQIMNVSEAAARKQVSRARESLLADLADYVG